MAGFWLQVTSQRVGEVLALADDLASGPGARPGVSFGPLGAPTSLGKAFRKARVKGDAILEAHGHLLDSEYRKRREQHFPWLEVQPRPSGKVEWATWMKRSLKHQMGSPLVGSGAAPSFLTTPSPVIKPADKHAELLEVLDASETVRADSEIKGECWTGVTVSRDYVTNEKHRTALLNAVLASNPSGVVFRARHTELPPVRIADYLAGFKEAVTGLAGHGTPVYLPETGLLGWMAMGWGAWGFSAGLTSGSWADREPTPMNRPAAPPNYIYEPQLLRPVRWVDHLDLIEQSGYDSCECPDCKKMDGKYSRDLAQRHQLRAAHVAATFSNSSIGQRQAGIRARIDEAIDFRDELPAPLRSRVEAGFLDAWKVVA